jgi:hypothetical protein
MIRLIVAYVDPGTGSFALQAVIGSIMGVSYMARNSIKSLARKLKREQPAEKSEKP